MKKPGYVCIGQIYTVHISMLRSYDWNFPADHFRLCTQSLSDVLTSIHQHHPGLTIMVETVSPVVAPSSVATLRQDSMGSRIRTSSYQTLPRYITYNESVTRTYTISHRLSRAVLDFFSRIVRNIGLGLSWALKPCLHFLRRNCGIILFLLAASPAGVGAVFGIIWIINLVCRGLAAAGQWVTGDWQLLLNAGGNVNAIVSHLIHTVIQAVTNGWHASVSALGGI